jgi:hypothetical protein
MDWSVQIDAVAPPGQEEPSLDNLTEDDRLGRLLEALDEWGGSVSGGRREWSARIAVEATDVIGAIAEAQRVTGEKAAAVGLPDWPVLRVEAVEWAEFEREMSPPR